MPLKCKMLQAKRLYQIIYFHLQPWPNSSNTCLYLTVDISWTFHPGNHTRGNSGSRSNSGQSQASIFGTYITALTSIIYSSVYNV